MGDYAALISVITAPGKPNAQCSISEMKSQQKINKNWCCGNTVGIIIIIF
jgi:hypothetical protein